VRAVSLRAEELTAAERVTRQLTLDPADDTSRRVEAVIDQARARFGSSVIRPAAFLDDVA
jgi:DNA polymerase-4